MTEEKEMGRVSYISGTKLWNKLQPDEEHCMVVLSDEGEDKIMCASITGVQQSVYAALYMEDKPQAELKPRNYNQPIILMLAALSVTVGAGFGGLVLPWGAQSAWAIGLLISMGWIAAAVIRRFE